MTKAKEFQSELDSHLEMWGPHCGAPRKVYEGHLRILLNAAVAAEREACGKLAAEFVDWDAGISVKAVAQEIAAAIRNRTNQVKVR